MKPRARRVAMGVSLLGAALVTTLVITNWGTVRDHIEAWHFQLTRETETLTPRNLSEGDLGFQILSTYANRRVIFDPSQGRSTVHYEYDLALTLDEVLLAIQEEGWIVLQQRLPHTAIVVIRAPEPTDDDMNILLRELDEIEQEQP